MQLPVVVTQLSREEPVRKANANKTPHQVQLRRRAATRRVQVQTLGLVRNPYQEVPRQCRRSAARVDAEDDGDDDGDDVLAASALRA